MNVAATDKNGNKASFSNFGSWVDIAAPGVEHSVKGREMVKAITGTEWQSHGLDNLPETSKC